MTKTDMVAPGGDRRALADRAVSRPVRQALSGPPRADLLARLTDLVAASAEPGTGLSAREWVEAAVAAKALVSFSEALHLACVREVDRAMDANAQPGAAQPGAAQPGVTPAEGRWVLESGRRAADELAPALGIAPRTATCLVELARRVEDELPAAADALADGRMNLSQVRVLDQVTRELPVLVTRAVEEVAVREAGRRTTAQLRVRLTSEAARLNPAYHAEAVERGVAERDVRLTPSPLPGCRRLLMDLPMLHAAAAWHALNGAAKAAKAARTAGAETGVGAAGAGAARAGAAGAGAAGAAVENRSLPQLRADLATAILTGQQVTGLSGGAAAGLAPAGLAPAGLTPAGLTPALAPVRVPSGAELTRFAEIHVVVALDTLTGASDLPAHLAGTGPVDTDTVIAIARTAPLRRLVADPGTGVLLRHDTHTRAPLERDPQGDVGPLGVDRQGVDPQGVDRQGVDPQGVDPRLQQMLGDPLAEAAPTTTAYRPGARLRAHVHTRDQTCIGPAREHATAGTDLDHTVNYGEVGADGRPGTTANGNLGSPCRRAHDSKTHGGWQLEQPSPGAFTWTSPTDRTYRVDARSLVPGWVEHRAEPSREPP